MSEYTAADLERDVLDPLFYRYERSIRAQVRLEHDLARLRPLEAEVAILRRRTVTQDATAFRLEAEARMAAPKLKALYDGALALLVEVNGHPHKNSRQRKSGIQAATIFLRNALDEAHGYCDPIPF